MGNDNKISNNVEAVELEKLKRENDALKRVVADLAVDYSISKQANKILKKAANINLVQVAKEIISQSTLSKVSIARAPGISCASI